MANNSDLGQQLSLSGSGITTAYQAGSPFYAGAANGVLVVLKVITDAASALTSVTVKLQGTYDGTNWYDLLLSPQNTGGTAVDNAFTVAANATVAFALATSSNRYSPKGLRLLAKANASGTGVDAITCSVVAW